MTWSIKRGSRENNPGLIAWNKMTKKLLLINAGAGRARRSREMQDLLAQAAQQPDLRVHQIEPGDDVAGLVRRALREGVTAVGAAGGDGTINLVASPLVGSGVPLVVIPFGTLNHFARDMGIPATPTEALALFADDSATQAIDVGEVNGHFFLNNSSVGLYPRLVKQRERYEKRLGKPLAYALAGWNVLRQPLLLNLELNLEGKTEKLEVGILFFSNNRAVMTPLQAGHRPRLDDQVLDTYIVRAGSPWQLFRVAASFLRNRLVESPLVTQAEIGEATVSASKGRLRVALDGEVQRLAPPLRYRIRPTALLVRVPTTPTAEPQS